MWGRGECCWLSHASGVYGIGLLLGMCESVRTRNTLHIVGAAKSKIWHNAVEGRKKMKEIKKREKDNKIITLIKY